MTVSAHMSKRCVIEGCGQRVFENGLCRPHFKGEATVIDTISSANTDTNVHPKAPSKLVSSKQSDTKAHDEGLSVSSIAPKMSFIAHADDDNKSSSTTETSLLQVRMIFRIAFAFLIITFPYNNSRKPPLYIIFLRMISRMVSKIDKVM